MGLQVFKRVQSLIDDLNTVQSNVAAVFQQISLNPFITGVWIKNQTISGSPYVIKIAHNLGAMPQGFMVTKLNAGTHVWQLSADATFITLSASSAVTFDVWIF